MSSGVACYRAVDLMRDLRREGARVRVVLTAAAAELVRPALFEALSGEPVGTGLWGEWESDPEGEYGRFPHLDFARGVDAVIVAPATANVLAKAAAGIADDLLTTTLLAVDPARVPVLFVPSMNASMYAHPASRANRETLRARGCGVLTPDEGPLACGEWGRGRWPGSEPVRAALDRMMNGSGRLSGTHVLVTAGRTESDLDPARTITNRSSGKMGFAIARAAWREGARVTLVHGVTSVEPPPFVETVAARTPERMAGAVLERLDSVDQLWMAAAVGDWRPSAPGSTKLKKDDWDGVLRLERTEDILARAAIERAPGTLLIGFAVETVDDLEGAARAKLDSKGCDFIVANDPREEGAGFEADTNRVVVVGKDDSSRSFERMDKNVLAVALFDHVLERARVGSPAGR